MPKARFRRGDTVRLSAAGRDNDTYSKFMDATFVITHVATRYMKASDFFSQGRPDGYHPGYDAATGDALYDLMTADGQDVPFSLYDWELVRA